MEADAGVVAGLLRMCTAPLPSSSRRRLRPREKTVPDAPEADGPAGEPRGVGRGWPFNWGLRAGGAGDGVGLGA